MGMIISALLGAVNVAFLVGVIILMIKLYAACGAIKRMEATIKSIERSLEEKDRPKSE